MKKLMFFIFVAVSAFVFAGEVAVSVQKVQ